MIKRPSRLFSALVVAGLAVVTGLMPVGNVLNGQVAAALSPTPATPKGLSISPFLQQLSVQPTDTDKSFTLTLSNHTDSVQELDLSSKDFGSLNDTGGVILEGSNDNYSQKYGLTSWLTLEKDSVVLKPNQSATVLVTVNNRQSLQPGGHYGAIIASVNTLNQATGNKVLVNQQLTALVLVTKIGGEHYDLKLSEVNQNGNWLHLPNDIRLRFQNPGNVHVVPRGLVKLKNPAGTVVAQGIINTESAFVLPESFRQLYVPLQTINKAVPLPGVYHLEVDYRYDGLNRNAVKSYAVRFINLSLYLGLLVLLSLLVWQLRRFVARRRKQPADTETVKPENSENAKTVPPKPAAKPKRKPAKKAAKK